MKNYNISVLDKVNKPGIVSIDCPIGRFQHELDYQGASSPRSDRSLVLDLASPLYYPSSLSRIYDRSPYGNHGTLTDVIWVRLPSGLWVNSFNGITSDINCGNDGSLNLYSTLSIEMWISITADEDGFFIAKGNPFAAGGGYGLYFLQAAGALRFYDDGTSSGNTVTAFSTNDVWGHLVVTNNGQAGGCLFYKDGILLDTKTETMVTNSDNLHIGNRSGTGEFPNFRGSLPCLYNYILTPADIWKHSQEQRRFFGA